jgi:hypothetical protein
MTATRPAKERRPEYTVTWTSSPIGSRRGAQLAALELCDLADQRALHELSPRAEDSPKPNDSKRTPTVIQRLAGDPNGSHLMNFPFAFTVFILLMIGAIVMCAGMMVPNVGATAIGFLLTLLGTALYCGRLPDE